MKSPLKHLDVTRGSHGSIHYYYRKNRQSPRIPLPQPSDPENFTTDLEFLKAYMAAVDGRLPDNKPVKHNGSVKGTLAWLIADYFTSTDYLATKEETKKKNRSLCNWLSKHYGAGLLKDFKTTHIEKILTKRYNGDGKDEQGGPGARNNVLKILRVLFKRAVRLDHVTKNPTEGFKELESGEWRVWEESEVEKFIEKHKNNPRAMLAFELAVSTGQRRSDLAAMRLEHIRGNLISVRQIKTGTRVIIPIHSSLQAALDAFERPIGCVAVFPQQNGRNYTRESFGNLFGELIRKAKLEHGATLHGLRKVMCVRLAQVGCSTHQIAAISGHLTLAEIEGYTRGVNQEKLAFEAMKKLEGGAEIGWDTIR